ncbi:uncharacterized protein J8A68_005278, partial [[Candida] subhashii]
MLQETNLRGSRERRLFVSEFTETKQHKYSIAFNGPEAQSALIIKAEKAKDKFKIKKKNYFSFYLSRRTQPYVADQLIETTATQELYMIISVYIPTISNSARRELHGDILHDLTVNIKAIKKKIQRKYSRKLHIILGGDFNSSTDDLTGNTADGTFQPNDITQNLLRLIKENNLEDTFRSIIPTMQVATNLSNGNNRRLDRIYLSHDTMDQLHSFQLIPREVPKATFQNQQPNNFSSLLRNMKVTSQLYSRAKSIMQKMTEIGHHEIEEDVWDKGRYIFHGTEHSHVTTKMKNETETQVGSTTKEILKIATDFYARLFDTPMEIPEDDRIDEYLEDFDRQITTEVQRDLDKPFELKELQVALEQSINKTVPGEDGFPYSFYLSHWDMVADSLLKEANQLRITGVLSPMFNKVLISLIPKKESSTRIDQQRPISLTNTSLKLISTMINLRLLPVLDPIIGIEQRGFMPNRTMDEAIKQLKTLANILQENPIYYEDAGIIVIDFQKAFDSFNHKYLRRVLEKINIGTNMRKCITAILTQQSASIYLNKTIGCPFPLKRGTRQGNPLSPLIFNLMLEPLLNKINQKCQGITIPSCYIPDIRAKYQAYADDLVIFATGEDYKIVKEELDEYCQVSSSAVNTQKSEIFFAHFRQLETWNGTLPYPAHLLSDFKTYLGIKIFDMDYKEKIKDIMKPLNSRAVTDMPMHERALIINSFVYSKIYFHDIHHPFQMNEIVELDKVIKDKLPQMNSLRLHAHPEKGGINLTDLTYQLKGKRAKQILLLFDESENWYSVYLRDKIQQFLFWYAEPNNILWMQFLSGAKLKSNQRDEGGRRQ